MQLEEITVADPVGLSHTEGHRRPHAKQQLRTQVITPSLLRKSSQSHAVQTCLSIAQRPEDLPQSCQRDDQQANPQYPPHASRVAMHQMLVRMQTEPVPHSGRQ